MAKYAPSGARRHLITIQQLTESQGDSGEPVENFNSTLCTMRAKLEAVEAPERFTEGMLMDQITARAWIKFTVPYRSDMDPFRLPVTKTRRIVYLSRTYDIVAADLVERNSQVELLAISKVG